ncbi:UDP-N-acetylmuramate--L-alanine ligase [Candidatus Gracilibacteria bacterium]|nr:UDP-N-acetylmuramate--L-alanine ligase [Candidatus Gracilibacteria bacterium]
MQKLHLHVIGIGGIGVSALAHYYKRLGYSVSGSDGANSPFLDTLRNQGFDIQIGHNASNLSENTDLVIYSEAIITKPDLTPEEQIYANPELMRARELGIRHISYPVALGEVFNKKEGIAITGSHGKSTTTAMTAIMLANDYPTNPTIELPDDGTAFYAPTAPGCSAIIGTQVPQLGNSNFYTEPMTENFVIEACEYKRSFLEYNPYITVITNIDLDHLDYYKNLEDYISAFQSIVDQTRGFVLISADDVNSQNLIIPEEKKIIVGNQKIIYFPRVEENKDGIIESYYVQKDMPIPNMELQVPGDHLLQDAELAYTVGRLLGMKDDIIVPKLEGYRGSWRRSEIVGTTKNGNMVMSDYGHHPSEIKPTLKAIHDKYSDKKLFVVFQPHQYSRTRELLQEFAISFENTDSLLIPNIYFSRDKTEDVEWMTTEKLITEIAKHQPHVSNGNGLENTVKLIREYDISHPDSSIILLLGAGDIDSIRNNLI